VEAQFRHLDTIHGRKVRNHPVFKTGDTDFLAA
jgi:hypothetical protein